MTTHAQTQVAKVTDTRAVLMLLGLCIVAITVLAALSIPVPEVLVTLALVLAGVGGGAVLPRPTAGAATPVAPSGGAGVIQR